MTTRKPTETHCPDAHGRCNLALTINGRRYRLRGIPSGWHRRAFALTTDRGDTYHVAQDRAGVPQCDCPDATFRDRRCKHIQALTALGVLVRTPANSPIAPSNPVEPDVMIPAIRPAAKTNFDPW